MLSKYQGVASSTQKLLIINGRRVELNPTQTTKELKVVEKQKYVKPSKLVLYMLIKINVLQEMVDFRHLNTLSQSLQSLKELLFDGFDSYNQDDISKFTIGEVEGGYTSIYLGTIVDIKKC